MSVNKAILLGNVGKDPDVRYPQQGQILVTFSLATTEHAYKTAEGAQIPERTEWHRIVMWGKNAEVAERYVHKGTRLYIEGKIRTRTWEDKNKLRHTITEIYADYFELLGQPRGDQQQQQQP